MLDRRFLMGEVSFRESQPGAAVPHESPQALVAQPPSTGATGAVCLPYDPPALWQAPRGRGPRDRRTLGAIYAPRGSGPSAGRPWGPFCRSAGCAPPEPRRIGVPGAARRAGRAAGRPMPGGGRPARPLLLRPGRRAHSRDSQGFPPGRAFPSPLPPAATPRPAGERSAATQRSQAAAG